MKRNFISFLWIEPSSVSHLSWVFWSKVYFKCVQNMYTPDQEAVKIRGAALEWGRGLGPGVYDLGLVWPCDLVLVMFPSLRVGWNVIKVTLSTQIMTGKYLTMAACFPEVWRGEERAGIQDLCVSVRAAPFVSRKGVGVALPGLVLDLFLAAPSNFAAGFLQCIGSENARYHVGCKHVVIDWTVCHPPPPADSHVEFLTPKVWKANLAF